MERTERTETPLRVGLIGHPVAHSRSPEMQQAAFDALGIAARYEFWETPPTALDERMASLRQPGVLGANITIPYKLAAMPYLDDLSWEARRVAGAVNTVVRYETASGVRLVGYNTDVTGLAATFREAGVDLEDRRVLVLGAGGAAQAVVGLAIQEEVGALTVEARRPEAAERLLAEVAVRLDRDLPDAQALDLRNEDELRRALSAADVLVNATSAGLDDPEACPLDPALLALLPRDAFVMDMLYAVPETRLLRAAREAGLRAVNGLAMLLYQGAAAFELWTGRDAPLDVMRAALGLAPA
jgi:shikimate dehydrogenase